MLNYKDVRNIAIEYNKNLLATDYRFKQSVKISHRDDSEFFFNCAFLMKRNNWIFIFTEHHGFYVYHDDDLKKYCQFLRLNDPLDLLEINET